MKNDASIRKLLFKYYNDQCSSEETRFLMQYLRSYADEDTVSEILDELYHKAENDNTKILMSEDLLWKKIEEKASTGTINRKSINRRIFVYSAAAVIVLLVAFAISFQHISDGKLVATTSNIITKSTHKGSKLNTYLPDGTKVKLNALSSIKYNEHFLENGERVVYLDGEAFFDVEHMETMPFKVITGEVTTTVLGTSFNVNAYKENEDVQVAVATGKVSVHNGSNRVHLNPNEMAVCPSKNEKGVSSKITKTSFHTEDILGWKDNVLVINNLRFEEIIRKLENWYGVEFQIEGQKDISGTFTHRYNNEPLDVVLEGLSFSAGFKYEIIKGDKVIIKLN